ncbi:MAG: type IV secretory system conjugative DNA transfer family protein, partial [Trueperaceae bacterium]|nr:type IV secretory system conjugative DNA transfer family protein [Trueperaceae bacterium]
MTTTYLGITTYRNQAMRFGIKQADRQQHLFCVGATGTGKSTLLETLAIQDMHNGTGLAFLDPHGDSCQTLLNHVPPHRIDDVIYFSPGDLAYPMAFNPMAKVGKDQRYLATQGIVSVFKNLFGDFWGPRTEHILSNVVATLLEHGQSTMLGINRLVSDESYRHAILRRVNDPFIKAFWEQEFDQYKDAFRQESLSSTRNKVGQFIASPQIRNILGQTKSTLSFRTMIDSKKIFIADLSKGKLSETASNLFGSLLITLFQVAAWDRVDTPPNQRQVFNLFVDEFQNFTTDAFIGTLGEARKFGLALHLATQYSANISQELKAAIIGNVGTTICFRVGEEDAREFSRLMYPTFNAEDLLNLPAYHIYLKLMIDGSTSRPFSAKTLEPDPSMFVGKAQTIIEQSRQRYCSKR